MKKLLLTPPSVEPVSLSEAKAHLVVDFSDDDAYITRLIEAARRFIEQRTGRAIMRQQWRIFRDDFADEMLVEPWPVKEIAQITYTAPDGTETTLVTSTYTYNEADHKLRLAYNEAWPSVRSISDAVKIDVWAGYYDASASPILHDIPEVLKQAILIMVGDLYEIRVRHSEVALFKSDVVDALLAPFVVYR